jgi:hypothetical protein
MDINGIIDELLEERKRLDRLIQILEAQASGRSVPKGRRGRKSMDGPARKEVSERMKRYWAQRRAQRAGSEGKGSLALARTA